jgi:hypothetical protein
VARAAADDQGRVRVDVPEADVTVLDVGLVAAP